MNKLTIFFIILLLCFINTNLKKLKQITILDRRTTPTYQQNGEVIWLDKQSVYCNPGEALQGFRLNRENLVDINYMYQCIKSSVINLNDIQELATPLKDLNGGKYNDATNYLDRHDVRCPTGYAIQGFNFVRGEEGTTTGKYKYKCVKFNIASCETGQTEETPGTNEFSNIHEIFYLSLQTVRAATGETVLTRFQLMTRYDPMGLTYYHYDFTYCFLLSNDYNRNTPAQDDGNGEVIYLDRHDISCRPWEVLKGFHLTRPTVPTLSYEFRCDINYTYSENISLSTALAPLPDDVMNGTNFLDRHDVKCPVNFALRGFKFVRGDGNTAKYDYTCVYSRLINCVNENTPETWGNDKTGDRHIVHYLDRQLIKIPIGKYALTQFKLNTRYADRTYYSYNYTYCALDY
jgi:hypothetical protein